MPRYFFSTANGHRLHDEEGDLLLDDDAARDMAIAIMAEILPSQRDQLNEGGRYSITVATEDRSNIYEITATGRRF